MEMFQKIFISFMNDRREIYAFSCTNKNQFQIELIKQLQVQRLNFEMVKASTELLEIV